MVVFCVHICELGLKYLLNVTYQGIKTPNSSKLVFGPILKTCKFSPKNRKNFSKFRLARIVVFSEHVDEMELEFPLIAT